MHFNYFETLVMQIGNGFGFGSRVPMNQFTGVRVRDSSLTGGLAGVYVGDRSVDARIARLANLTGVEANGDVSFKVPVKAPAYDFTEAGSNGIVMNGVRLGMLTTGSAVVTKERDIAETLVTWEHENVNVFADNINVPVNKTTYCDSLWVDARGNHYARIRTSYSTGVWIGSNINFWSTMNSNPSFEIQSLTEFVVVGFTYSAENENIWVPHSVQAAETDATTGLTVVRNYPVHEIWGGVIYGASVSNPATHALSIQELSKADNVLNVPKAIIAPYITKISLKRRLTQNHMSLFSGACPKVVYMPSLRKIVGGGRHSKTPIFCSNNSSEYYVSKLVFPALQSIKNCMFACRLAGLTSIMLPCLEEIKETIFLMDCPMLKELDLPHLTLIKGCDCFCANDYNLEKVALTSSFVLEPHTPERTQETQIETMELLRATLTVLSLNFARGLINGTNSMSYFFNSCDKLMNASTLIDAALSGAAAPMDGNYAVDRETGIFTIYNYKADHALKNATGFYGADTLIDVTQAGHRLEGSTYTYAGKVSEVITFAHYNGSYKGFAIEDTYKFVVAHTAVMAAGSAVPTGAVVCAVDPRTALMNTMTDPMASSSVFSTSTNTHIYSASTDIRMTVNPNEGLWADANIKATSEAFNSLIAPNQAYNAAAST